MLFVQGKRILTGCIPEGKSVVHDVCLLMRVAAGYHSRALSSWSSSDCSRSWKSAGKEPAWVATDCVE